MNYERHYSNLMFKAMDRDLSPEIYVEKHHWYPKSLWPEYKKEKWNIVKLTAKEHFIAHFLLWKMNKKCPKMTEAFWAMSNQRGIGQEKRYIPSSTTYAIARKAHVDNVKGKKRPKEVGMKVSAKLKGGTLSQEHKDKISSTLSGVNNFNYGKPRSQETKDKISAKLKGRKHNKERLIKMSENRKGKPAWNKGMKLTQEHKDKISNTLKKHKESK